MVTTRSMSREIKTVKPPPKVVDRNSTRRRKSGTAKTVKPPKVVERNPTRRKSPPKWIERNRIRMDAMSIFMIRVYLPQYFEANPRCPTAPPPNSFEVIRSGHEKWFYMSESEKAPWIELAKEVLAKGIKLRNAPAPDWLVYLLFVYHIGWYLLCSSICFPELTV